MTQLRLTPAMASHRGMRRRVNEDAVGYEYPVESEKLQNYGSLFIVADGVGGLDSGEEASRLAVEQLKRRFYGSAAGMPIEERMEAAVKQVNRDVYNAFNRKGATTLVAVVILDDHYIAVSVGDSQIFRIRDGKITQLNTEDVMHSNDQNNGALTKAIGYRRELDIDLLHGEIQPDDSFILCSDGLTRYVSRDDIKRLATMPDPRDSVRRLINQANNAGGADNISVLIVKVGDVIDLAEVAAHKESISVSVAVDTDPMMMPDVPSKPTTQIPLSRPEPNIPEEILTETEPLTTSASSQRNQAKERANVSTPPPRPVAPPAPLPQTADEGANNLVIIGAVAALVVGAVIFAIALFSLNSGSAPADTPATQVPQEDTTTDASSDEASPIDAQADEAAAIQIGDTIELNAATRTHSDIGGESDAFLAASNTPYLVDNIVQDTEGQSWYRLVESETGETGWLPADDLPGYTVQTGG